MWNNGEWQMSAHTINLFSDSAVDIHSPHFWIDWSWKSSIVFVGSFVVAVVAIPWKWLLKSTSIILLTFHLFFPPPHSISLARFLPIIVDRCDEKCDLCPGTKVYVWIYAVHIFHNRESILWPCYVLVNLTATVSFIANWTIAVWNERRHSKV